MVALRRRTVAVWPPQLARWPVGRCSCRLRSVEAVLMPNVFVPMHQPLLSRSLAPPGLVARYAPRHRFRPSRVAALTLSTRHLCSRPSRRSLIPETCMCVRVCEVARVGARIVEEGRMSGRTAAEMRVTGIGLHVPPDSFSPHPTRGTAAPVCVLF